jgi:hypothetical protein
VANKKVAYQKMSERHHQQEVSYHQQQQQQHHYTTIKNSNFKNEHDDDTGDDIDDSGATVITTTVCEKDNHDNYNNNNLLHHHISGGTVTGSCWKNRLTKITLKVLFSTPGLIALVVLYTIMGAFVFPLLETPAANVKNSPSISKSRDECLKELWIITGESFT